MINKQNLWFLTLFSLILVLGIYYLNIDDEVMQVLKTEDSNNNLAEVVEISESDILVALEVENDEEKQALMEEYQNILLDTESSVDEKNAAYENIQKLNNSTTKENEIKKMITEKFTLNSFVKIKDNSVSIVIASNKHDNSLANSIITAAQELFETNMYITVKFNG